MLTTIHDDVIKWKHFLRYWAFVRGIHLSLVISPHKSQWRRALMFSLICALNKQLSKQSWRWWFETPSRSLWRYCMTCFNHVILNSRRDLKKSRGNLRVTIVESIESMFWWTHHLVRLYVISSIRRVGYILHIPERLLIRKLSMTYTSITLRYICMTCICLFAGTSRTFSCTGFPTIFVLHLRKTRSI